MTGCGVLDKKDLVLEALERVEDISDIMREYDSVQHVYGGYRLYQTEAHMIEQVGDNPGINASQLAGIFKKSVSACSQIIKKLLQKKLIIQRYTPENCKIRRLYLTEAGEKVYMDHRALENDFFERDVKEFKDIPASELETFLKISEKIYECFRLDLSIQKDKLERHNNAEAQD